VTAYVIAEVAVVDPKVYERYRPLAAASIAAAGGRYLVRGGSVDSLEGEPVEGRVVVLEFPDLQSARSWYDSDEYRDALALRKASAVSRVFLVEGHAPS
jgi:uncharacterized protein (DUF1330 family)